ncbi:hypothetical protein FNL37_1706 [Methylovorus glucosotrophus]|uniref:hypothetical protein n=1 Tax=Methylovorus glucosotrophus TaxID=266009 RepID=UPI0013315EE0|nr:hypothetical protein [Methylovorus glucosotrophus]KAF0844262.1 hypothetical protein FNL37_1706 [Methylovorus glucosotrophus]
MSSYSNTIREYLERFKREKGVTGPVDPHEIAAWALKNGLLKPNHKTILDAVAADISQVFREEYRVDKYGRRYRAMHAVKQKVGNKQSSLWADMDDKQAPREHFLKSFSQRRQQVVGDCFQLKTDVDVYNEKNPDKEVIPLILDFTEDVAELQLGYNRHDNAA